MQKYADILATGLYIVHENINLETIPVNNERLSLVNTKFLANI